MRHRITADENCDAVAAFERDVLRPMAASPDLDAGQLKEMYARMRLIREFDTAVKELWKQDFIYGLAHSYVCAEAIAVGACAALAEGDYITSTHRGHGHTIAKGGDPRRMMAELMGRADGYNKGKGGSMHIAAVDMGMLGATGIVGSAMPIAVGAALTAKTLEQPFVTICFHGDGATNQVVWLVSINLAAAWDLPVIFLCENNQWAISMPYEQAVKNPSVADRAVGYGIPGVTVDGLADSKRLSPAAREELDIEIRARGEIGIGVVEVEEIDRINIYQARMEALRRAVGELAAPVDFVLVDGHEIPHLRYRQSAYVKGDTFVASIAAASIVAKVHRDAYMRELDSRYPAYGFARNMGYGTRAHIDALRRVGPSPVHRRTFRPRALRQSPLFAPSA